MDNFQDIIPLQDTLAFKGFRKCDFNTGDHKQSVKLKKPKNKRSGKTEQNQTKLHGGLLSDNSVSNRCLHRPLHVLFHTLGSPPWYVCRLYGAHKSHMALDSQQIRNPDDNYRSFPSHPPLEMDRVHNEKFLQEGKSENRSIRIRL